MKYFKLIFIVALGILAVSGRVSDAADFTLEVPYNVQGLHENVSELIVYCMVFADERQWRSNVQDVGRKRQVIPFEEATGSASGTAVLEINTPQRDNVMGYRCSLSFRCEGAEVYAGSPNPDNQYIDDENCYMWADEMGDERVKIEGRIE
ncbi:hypothetical protein H8E50_04260 [bacterium]|nr:hypothetical protein [bacterium]